jgi:DNA-binding FadR family transcriptional regulator
MGPLERVGLHDQIVRRLGLAILRGEMAEGDHDGCSELNLCRTLQVSRTALREATKVLASKGLVELRPKVGVRIRPRPEWHLLDPDLLSWQYEAGVDEKFIRNLCEVRLIVETAAVGLAAVRATAAERNVIQEQCQNMERNVRNKAAYDEADIRFHEALFAACHNELLQQMSGTIRTALSFQNRSGGEEDVDASLMLHKEISRLVVLGDAAGARGAMEALILHTAQTFHQAFHPGSADGWQIYGSPAAQV